MKFLTVLCLTNGRVFCWRWNWKAKSVMKPHLSSLLRKMCVNLLLYDSFLAVTVHLPIGTGPWWRWIGISWCCHSNLRICGYNLHALSDKGYVSCKCCFASANCLSAQCYLEIAMVAEKKGWHRADDFRLGCRNHSPRRLCYTIPCYPGFKPFIVL